MDSMCWTKNIPAVGRLFTPGSCSPKRWMKHHGITFEMSHRASESSKRQPGQSWIIYHLWAVRVDKTNSQMIMELKMVDGWWFPEEPTIVFTDQGWFPEFPFRGFLRPPPPSPPLHFILLYIISYVAPPPSCGPSWLPGSSASQAVLLLHALYVSLGCLLCVWPAFSDLYAPLAFCFPFFLSWCLRSPFLVSCSLPAFSVLPFAIRWSWPRASPTHCFLFHVSRARESPGTYLNISVSICIYVHM